jgi:hypothetical protein
MRPRMHEVFERPCKIYKNRSNCRPRMRRWLGCPYTKFSCSYFAWSGPREPCICWLACGYCRQRDCGDSMDAIIAYPDSRIGNPFSSWSAAISFLLTTVAYSLLPLTLQGFSAVTLAQPLGLLTSSLLLTALVTNRIAKIRRLQSSNRPHKHSK